jgi:plastocyanin
LSACGSSNPPRSGSPADAAPASPADAAPKSGAVEVRATDALAFAPRRLTVAVGTTVRWVNPGGPPHTITSGKSSEAADSPGALFDSQLPGGARFEFTFTKVGDQPYFCRFHEGMGMTGVITVTAQAGDGGGG